MTATETAILGLMFVIVITVWAIIGFLLWIPLLVRTTAVFSVMIVHAIITGQKPDVLRSHLESACRFYPEGFRIAYDTIYKPTNSQVQPVEIRFWQVLGECLWTLVFWILLLLVFHSSPLEAISTVRDWVATIPLIWWVVISVIIIVPTAIALVLWAEQRRQQQKQQNLEALLAAKRQEQQQNLDYMRELTKIENSSYRHR